MRNTQGMAQPYYDQARGQALQASSPITGGTVQQYLNPYTDWVTKNLNEVFGKQQRDVTGGLTQAAGGVGADRIGVAQSELARQQGLAAGQTYSGIYNNALQAAQTDASRGLQGAGMISNLGTTAQNSALQGLQALLGSGGQQQQLSQSQLQSLWNQLASQFSFGFQRPQYEAGIVGSLAPAAGGTSQGTQVTTAPPPSLLSQILGGVTGGIGLAGGAGAFSGSGSGKGSGAQDPGYGLVPGSYNPGSYAAGFSPTFQNGMYVPTINRGGRVNRRYADGGATATKPPASFMDYFNNMFGVGDGQEKLQGLIGAPFEGLMDSLKPGALIGGLAKGEFPQSGLLGMMQNGGMLANSPFGLLTGHAEGGPVSLPTYGLRNAVPYRPSHPARPSEVLRGDPGSRVYETADNINEMRDFQGGNTAELQPVMAGGGGVPTGTIGNNPFDTSDIGSFDAPLQPRPTRFPPLNMTPPKTDSGSSGPGIGDMVKVAAQLLPLVMANRGGAVVNAYQGYDDGGGTPSFEERFPNPSYELDASGMSASRGPVFPSIRNAERLRDALTNRGIPAAAGRQLQRLLNSFDSGGNVEPLRMSEEKMADALRRLQQAGLLNRSAAKDFAAARYKRMGIDPEQAVGAPAKYQFGGTTGQKFNPDWQDYDTSSFDPNLPAYGGDTDLPPDNSLGLGKKPNWSPIQTAAPALVGAGATNKDLIDADEAGGEGGGDTGDTTTFSGKAYDDSGAFRRFVNTPYPGPTEMPGSKMPYPDATSRGGFGNEFPRSPWEALARAGFATMAGTSPYAGVNIGHGALEGLKALDEQRKSKMNEEEVNLRAQGLWQQMQQHADQYKYMTPAQKLNAIQQERLYRKQIEQLEQQGLHPYAARQDQDGRTVYRYTKNGTIYEIDPDGGPDREITQDDTGAAPPPNPYQKKQQEKLDTYKQEDEGKSSPIGVDDLKPNLVPKAADPGPLKGPPATAQSKIIFDTQKRMDKAHDAVIVQRENLDALKRAYVTVMKDNDKDGFWQKLMTMPGATPGMSTESRLGLMRAANTAAMGLGKPPPFNPDKIAAMEEAHKIQYTMGTTFASTISPRDSQQMQLGAIAAQPGFTQSPRGMMRLIGLYDGLASHGENQVKFWNRWNETNPRNANGWVNDFDEKNPVGKTIIRTILENQPNQAALKVLPDSIKYLRDHKDDKAVVEQFNKKFSGTASYFLTGRLDPYAELQ